MKSLSISADDNIAIITHRKKYFSRYYRLFTYDMKGTFLKNVYINPILNEINTYDEVIYTLHLKPSQVTVLNMLRQS